MTLGETGFTGDGAPFAGDTTVVGAAGSGKWGGRWSDSAGSAMGGTFGFAADDSSLAVLGAFTACSCVSGAPGEWRSTTCAALNAVREAGSVRVVLHASGPFRARPCMESSSNHRRHFV